VRCRLMARGGGHGCMPIRKLVEARGACRCWDGHRSRRRGAGGKARGRVHGPTAKMQQNLQGGASGDVIAWGLGLTKCSAAAMESSRHALARGNGRRWNDFPACHGTWRCRGAGSSRPPLCAERSIQPRFSMTRPLEPETGSSRC